MTNYKIWPVHCRGWCSVVELLLPQKNTVGHSHGGRGGLPLSKKGVSCNWSLTGPSLCASVLFAATDQPILSCVVSLHGLDERCIFCHLNAVN